VPDDRDATPGTTQVATNAPGQGRAARSARSVASASLNLNLQRLALLVAVLIVWQILAGRVIPTFWISSPSLILTQLTSWWHSGQLVSGIVTTYTEMILGFLLGATAGIVIGCAFGWWRKLADLLNVFIIAINSIPKIALAPLLILYLGIGLQMKVVLAAAIVFFIVFYNTYTGARDVDADVIDGVRVMGAKKLAIFRYVILPSAMVSMFAGLRVSVPFGMLGAITGEILAANSGMGFLIMNSSAQFNTAGVFAALVVLIAMAGVVNGLVGLLENFLLRWKRNP